LVRDVAYQQIPRAARARKHRAVAEWIERMTEDRVGDQAEILVHHYGQALELTRAAGAQGEDELEAALVRVLVMAGGAAAGLAVAKAGLLYGRVLELLPAGHVERAGVLAKAAEAAHRGARYPEAERACREAIEEFRAQDRPLGEAEVTTRLGNIAWSRGRSAE